MQAFPQDLVLFFHLRLHLQCQSFPATLYPLPLPTCMVPLVPQNLTWSILLTTKNNSHRKVNMTNPNPSSKHTNHAFIISIVVSAIGVILISLVCFAIGYWLRNKLMAPPPPPKRSSTVHQVLHSTKMVPLVPQNLTQSILTTKNTPTGRSTWPTPTPVVSTPTMHLSFPSLS